MDTRNSFYALCTRTTPSIRDKFISPFSHLGWPCSLLSPIEHDREGRVPAGFPSSAQVTTSL